ncbi:MerR family DNA-binding transcriptional regulator [Schumannella luteola]|uniref:DNA-binding transcriptional MerR regulator n=1 Tax=Schumannella luteola TaxID=472059 RepID=A0A852YG73_9MICO|nr:MerR family transcriptional regulator [Schumannella luteola]NYG98807.1 DNA-binding transcriptional MerR regulator [Schumannella luteola]TPX01929.1 MerR family DNA-binding transcriptional regulator [Schumannella luteola]
MAWSTRQLAELAGTTVKAVRHYHRIGLLDEPERLANGYKQYQTVHLVRLLQIRRMSDLGIPLAQIAELSRADENPADAVRMLDAEIDATIERLQRVRAELAVVLEYRAPLELPAAFGTVADQLDERWSRILTVLSTVLDEQQLDDLRHLIAADDGPEDDGGFGVEFAELAADADATTRERLARLMAASIRADQGRFPWLSDPIGASPRRSRVAEEAISAAFLEAFNPAQLLVLARADALAREGADAAVQDGVTASPRGASAGM